MVEGALANLVPVAIDLLAKLLGLGGLGAKVREIIEGVQESVDSAIERLIEKIKGMFRGGADGGGPEAEATPGEGEERASAEERS